MLLWVKVITEFQYIEKDDIKGNSTEVEYRHFMGECWQNFMETFTKCATLS